MRSEKFFPLLRKPQNVASALATKAACAFDCSTRAIGHLPASDLVARFHWRAARQFQLTLERKLAKEQNDKRICESSARSLTILL